jgi:hypothetical protein
MTRQSVPWLAAALLFSAGSASGQYVVETIRPEASRPGIAAPDATGTLSGRVVDAATGEGIPDALVQTSGPDAGMHAPATGQPPRSRSSQGAIPRRPFVSSVRG